MSLDFEINHTYIILMCSLVTKNKLIANAFSYTSLRRGLSEHYYVALYNLRGLLIGSAIRWNLFS